MWISYPGHEQVYCVGRFEANTRKLFADAQEIIMMDIALNPAIGETTEESN